jgi:epoxide hydrolase-like predicted phosphatase
MHERRGYTALLVDFGGVLTTSVWDSFADFCRAKGLEEGTVKRLFREDPGALADLRGLETGAIEEGEFERRFAERLGLDEATDLIDSMFRGMLPSEPMVAAVRTARERGIKTGLVSNSWSTSHYDRDMLDELFDTAVISAEVGLHKPQPEIYRLAAERLDVEPRECIFVDDLRENCEGAEAVGMTAVRHRNAVQTIANLAELSGLTLTASPPGRGDKRPPSTTARGSAPRS